MMPVVTLTTPLGTAAFATRPWPKMTSRLSGPAARAASAIAAK